MSRKRIKTEDLLDILKKLEKVQVLNSKSLNRLEEEWHQQEASKTAFVTSAIPLTKEEKQKLAIDLGFVYGKNFIIRTRVSPEVIGGLKIQIGSTIIDATIKSQLERMRDLLTKDAEV